MKKRLKVAMIAPPWLNMPPLGYGGIENVVHYLTLELQKLGAEVHLFSVGDTTTKAHRLNYAYDDGQYRAIHRPMYESGAIPINHIMLALDTIKAAGDFDIIHDHNGFIGPAMMAELPPQLFPPVLHTLHGPFSTDEVVASGVPDNRPMYARFKYRKRLHFNGISHSQLRDAPPELRHRLVDVVHNAVDLEDLPLQPEKGDYFITLARFNRDKGIGEAARICEELDLKLKMAGIVGPIFAPRQMILELANPNSPYRTNPDFMYFRDQVLPHTIPGQIEYVGAVNGKQKLDFISRAKALLWPIDWEEPFGMAPIEVMATGTPVVAYRRGAVPEMIIHGVNGFIADTPEEFKEYMLRVDEIKPEDCRAVVEERFSASVMAAKYLDRYQQIIAQHTPKRSLSYAKLAQASRAGLMQAGAFAEVLDDEAA